MVRRRLFHFRAVPRKKRTLILVCMLFWSVIAYLVISRFIFGATEIVGRSMEPTLRQGDRFIINRLAYRFRNPRRGEIVAIQMPGEKDLSVKRIIALPLERVQVKNNHVYVNGRKVDEPHLNWYVRTTSGPMGTNTYEVEPGCYFVLGDNREGSVDSRAFGAVRRAWIRGPILANRWLTF